MAQMFILITSILILTTYVFKSECHCSVGKSVRRILKGTKVCLETDDLLALADLETGSRLSEEKIYFSAYLTSHSTASSMSKHQPVNYTDVVTNEGSGYNPTTGEFTAPRSGGYVFFWEFLVFAGGNIWLELQINGKFFAHNLGHGADSMYEVASKSTIVNLKEGDKVRVVFYGGNGKLYGGNRYTGFSGFSLT